MADGTFGTAAFSVQVKGLDAALRKLDRQRVQQGMQRGMQKVVITLSDQAKLNATARPGPQVDTGRLRSSITGTVRNEGASLIGVIGSNVIYARIHELGGVITAKNAPFLVFKTKDDVWHKVRSVTIPARPYLAPAITSPFGQNVINTLLTREIKAALDA